MKSIKKLEKHNQENQTFFVKYSKSISTIMILICIVIILYIVFFSPSYNPDSRHYQGNTTTPGVYELNSRIKRKLKNTEIRKGYELIQQKRFLEALNHFKSLLNTIHHPPERKFVYFFLGEIHFHQKNYSSAIVFYDNSLNIDDSFFECLIKRGMCSSKLGKYEDGLFYLKKAHSIKPKSFLANFEIGKVYFFTNNFEKALESFKESLKITNDIRAYFYKGVCLYKLSQHDKAIEIFKNISKTETSINYRKAAINELAKHYYSEGRYNKVLEYLMILKSIDPGNENVSFELGKVLYLLKKYREAYNNLEDAFERAPHNHNILIYLAMSEIAMKKYRSALGHIKRYMKFKKNYYKNFRIAGDAYFGLAEYKRALLNYNIYFKLVPEDKIDNQIFFRIANIYDTLGKYDKAINYLNKCKRFRNIPKKDIFYNLAVVYDHKTDYENALYYLLKTLKISNEKEKLRSYIGDIYLKMNRFSEAIEFYKRVLKYSPESQIASYKIANAFFTQGLLNKSRVYFNKILNYKKDPKSKNSITALAYMRLGDIENIEQNFIKAISFYQKGMKYNLKNKDIQIRLSRTYILGRYYNKGESLLRKLLTSVVYRKKRSQVYYLMGLLKYKQGFKNRAIEYLKKSLKLNPSNESTHTLLSNIE